MKGLTFIPAYGLILTPTCAFVAPSSLSTARVSPDISRNGRTKVTLQLSVAIESSRPVLPPGKRIVRKKRKAPSESASVLDVDITNAPVEVIRSESDYLTILKENQRSLVVMKFFAPWCRSCKSMDLKYKRLAVEHDDVKFYEVDILESPDLKKAMGVKAVPTVKLHAGRLGQVFSFSCGPKKVPALERKIKLCKDVSALTARVSRDSSMVENSQGQINGTQTEDDMWIEPIAIVKELVEKFEMQDKVSMGTI